MSSLGRPLRPQEESDWFVGVTAGPRICDAPTDVLKLAGC